MQIDHKRTQINSMATAVSSFVRHLSTLTALTDAITPIQLEQSRCIDYACLSISHALVKNKQAQVLDVVRVMVMMLSLEDEGNIERILRQYSNLFTVGYIQAFPLDSRRQIDVVADAVFNLHSFISDERLAVAISLLFDWLLYDGGVSDSAMWLVLVLAEIKSVTQELLQLIDEPHTAQAEAIMQNFLNVAGWDMAWMFIDNAKT